MPVTVNAALRESLAGSAEPGHQHHHHSHQLLQTQMASATKQRVLQKIEYEPYPENYLAQNDSLKSKYILLSATSTTNGDAAVNGTKKALTSPTPLNGSHTSDSAASPLANGTPKKDNKNELPLPKRVLFPRDRIKVGWKGSDRKWQVGSGFINVGNTCYLNSTLQALLHVPAMANWLASDTEHREKCGANPDMACTICAVANTLRMSQSASHAVKPYPVYSRLRMICRHMMVGRQEDAHEFLRYLIEAMEKAYMERFPKSLLANLDQYSKETTPLNQILGFYLRSSVRCLSCNHVSMTFQHFEDLLLDIRKSNTVDEALQGYFAREKLDDMDYTCSGCKKKVNATKQFSIERPPIVLCIQLKRFSMQGNKLNKQVSIKPKLDLTPYVRRAGGGDGAPQQSLTYRLVSMVTHLGSSQHCGHYTAIGLTESGAFYQFDDSSVHPIALQNVLQTNAYIIFYELESIATQQPRNGLASATMTLKTAGLTNGAVKIPAMTNGFQTQTKALQNGNGTSQSNGFIGPLLNKPSNGQSPSTVTPKKDTSLTNGNSSGLTNGHTTQKTPTKTPETAAGSASTVKKYPSAAELFRTPTKSPSDGEDKSKNVVQISPKSLVPYNSCMTSDEDDTDTDDGVEKNPRKAVAEEKEDSSSPKVNGNGTSNGHATSYVDSSGEWKVVSAEKSSPPTPPSKGIVFKGVWSKADGNQKNGKALNELLKQDHNAYGGVAVNTWSGEKSNLDKETSAEKNLKRSSDRKADDDEMDRGHVKKVKKNHQVGRDNPGFNPFQELENKNNQGMANGGSNGYRPPHNRHHHHHQNGQGRSWVNNDRNGSGYKSKFSGQHHKNRTHNHNKWRSNFKSKHGGGHQRFKGGNYPRGGGNNHRHH